jgi:hypothetical protein
MKQGKKAVQNKNSLYKKNDRTLHNPLVEKIKSTTQKHDHEILTESFFRLAGILN